MTVAPLIAMKSTKCESLEAVGKELDRRAHTYANDVDQSGRHIGYICRAGDESPVPLEQAIERRMGELNTKRKIRDNQVRAMGFIVSSNDALDENAAREFLDKSVQWFGARYGFEKRGMLDEIAARCDGLRGRVSQFVEEVREAVGRLGLAIADLTRRLGPRSARMTTKALKRDLAALERDYGEDDDRSLKARAAEAQRAARARDANRDDRPPQRSWSQSR